MRLSHDAVLPTAVARPRYDRDAQAVGIIHFGIGAFHRAHQAVYTDDAMNAGERDWMIAGVSLRSPAVAEQLNPQSGLYSISGTGNGLRVVGSVRTALVAFTQREAIADLIAAPTTHIISLTITEKGYCSASNGDLDFQLADSRSVFRHIADGLQRRQSEGRAGLTLLSCDNLANNGQQLRMLLRQYIERYATDLGSWFDAECACPSTMVDRIVPATTNEDRDQVERQLGYRDEGAVLTEPFSQWVVEDCFSGRRPSWENHGAQLVTDVAPYETAKLRMLNGAHSAMAYIGLMRGYEFVHEAISDPEIEALCVQLMTTEAAPTIKAAPAQDLETYASNLLERFHNRSINHRLAQIAMDGSQKIPQRWLQTLAARQIVNESCPAILEAIAAWIEHLRNSPFLDDPRGDELRDIARSTSNEQIGNALFGPNGALPSQWQPYI